MERKLAGWFGFPPLQLFVILLVFNMLSQPHVVWEKTWSLLSDGIIYEQRSLSNNQDLDISKKELMNLTLCDIETMLRTYCKSLRDFPPMSFPTRHVHLQQGNSLIAAGLEYDKQALTEEYNNLKSSLIDEQKRVLYTILHAVDTNSGGMFFLYDHGGTGKTFLWRTLTAAIRSTGNIVIAVASSGIASLLLLSGRTAHSKFSIPVPTEQQSTYIDYLKSRAILASTIDVVDQLNEKVLKSVPGQEKEYLSSDKADIDNNSDISSEVLITEFLNSLTTSGLPNHKLY
ncbi:hypothetical protein L6164_013404 [Bauhinia variegata]|uniref:Uncharacterized protein n=1 Tax=Bauhinia variegata TaxID=167791 RepID=A0ACB9NFT0_BAUVA|nr:hypothetical protein L6164_013404 [Bauhinia variegata]